jgi:predicted metal-binding protein
MNRPELEKIFLKHGFDDYTWISASDIEVAQWVRMKCTYGCGSYGQKATCPPSAPSFEECRRFFTDYEEVVLFHFNVKLDDPDTRDIYTRKVNSELLKVEREVFLADYRKVFLFFMDECQLCAECPGKRTECINPRMARPSPESFCVDVFATVKKFGYPIEVLKDYDRIMNRYAFLMVE